MMKWYFYDRTGKVKIIFNSTPPESVYAKYTGYIRTALTFPDRFGYITKLKVNLTTKELTCEYEQIKYLDNYVHPDKHEARMIEFDDRVDLETKWAALERFNIEIENKIENITLEGGGTVKTSEEQAIGYYPKGMQFDLRSITSIDGVIQLYGFNKANEKYMPVKIDGHLKWVPMSLNIKAGTGTEVKITLIDDKDKVTLEESGTHITPEPNKDFTLVLPEDTTDQYTKIVWRVEINDGIVPDIDFPPLLSWDTISSGVLSENTIHLFEFETWDNGDHWIGHSRKVMRIPLDLDQELKDYLNANYLTRVEANTLMVWNRTTPNPLTPTPAPTGYTPPQALLDYLDDRYLLRDDAIFLITWNDASTSMMNRYNDILTNLVKAPTNNGEGIANNIIEYIKSYFYSKQEYIKMISWTKTGN